jgi:hypothetical protein
VALALVYDGGAPNQLSGNEMTQWIQANSFTLGAADTIVAARFWDINATTGFSGSITWAVYANNAGSPGALLNTGSVAGFNRVDTGNSVLGLEEFRNDLNIGAVALAAGTYWLGLHNGPLSNQARAEFYWETTSAAKPAGAELVAPFNGSWTQSSGGNPHAFQLFDTPLPSGSTTPEPSSLFLLGSSGVIGLGYWLRRRNRAAN